MSKYEIVHLCHGPAGDRDAVAVSLRLTCDGAYYQYFQALATELTVALRPTWMGRSLVIAALCEEAADRIETWVHEAEKPLADPTQAIQLFPDAQILMERANRPGLAVPKDDHVMRSFSR